MRRRTGYRVGPLAFLIFRFASCHLTAQFVGVDPAYPAGDGPDSIVRAVALQPDGRVLIGGLFTNVNGLTRPYLARLNVDGALDESFSPQLNLDPRGIFPQSDGRIFISGSFTNVNGASRFNLAILNSDGSLDTSFEPPLPSRSSDTLTGVPSPDGSVWVTGPFTNLGGLPRNRFARLLANGSVDVACPSPFTATNSLTVAAAQPDGRVLVAGNFHAVAGTAMVGVSSPAWKTTSAYISILRRPSGFGTSMRTRAVRVSVFSSG